MTSREHIRILRTYGEVAVTFIDGKWWATLKRRDGMHQASRVSMSRNLSISGLYQSVAGELYLEVADD